MTDSSIKEAYEMSGMTVAQICQYLKIPKRTFQDWVYEKRNPKRKDIADKIKAMSILTQEGRDSLILEDDDWDTVMSQYKIEQARSLSKIGSFPESFSLALKRVPISCINLLSAEALAELIDALNQAYHDGQKERE